jgi:ABC-type multidrug transport system ATPase subunit
MSLSGRESVSCVPGAPDTPDERVGNRIGRMGQEFEAVALSKRFGRGRPVFDDVSFVLEPGTVTTLSGGNGSGKSTLLRICAGVSVPTSGRIAGRSRELAIVPERFVPPGNLTAWAYLTHLARIRGVSGRDAGRSARDLLDRLRLEPGSGVAMRLLSKGNAQKVAIAQAFASTAELLILDEPRAGLDSAANLVLDELISEARGRGVILILSGHEERMPPVVDQALVLVGGRLSAAAEPATGTAGIRLLRILLAGTQRSAPLDGLAAVAVSLAEDAVRPGSASIVVPEDRVDGVLRFALDRGWSVREVRDVDGAGSDAGGDAAMAPGASA